ncbi:MAG TPA: RlpA-like double-psi beta-barrel domain-containing protein [Arenibaculum sp.]|nr:RlpA-like double-psi beta-barrel domain-containing protein [Arenibaculum sp.]
MEYRQWFGPVLAMVAVVALAGCIGMRPAAPTAGQLPDRKATFLVGDAYEADGVWYYPAENYRYDEAGLAAVYPDDPGRGHTTNGEAFDQEAIAAGHATLQLPSLVRVTNLDSGLSLVVRVNDRGTAPRGRIIELSRHAARLLGGTPGVPAKVRVAILPEESMAAAAALLAVPSTPTRAGVSPDGAPAPMAAPVLVVDVEGMPPPPASRGRDPFDIASRIPGTLEADGRFLPAPVATQFPTGAGPHEIFVQAGAFSIFDVANRMRARFSTLAPARIDPVMVAGTQFFRVRLGPLRNAEHADRILAQVLGAEANGARIVVD